MSGSNKPVPRPERTNAKLVLAAFVAGFVASYFIPTLVVVLIAISAALFLMNHFL